MRTFLAVVVAIITIGYLLPTAIAIGRKQHNTPAIFVLNLCLGWTGLGWIAALVWAFSK